MIENTESQSNLGRQKVAYDKYANEYHKLIEKSHTLLYSYTIEKWKKEVRGLSVLDLGCGTGYVEKELHPYVSYIIGIDISEECIKIAKQQVKAKNVAFIVGDAVEIRYIRQKFDVITSYGFLHHVEQPERVIENAIKLLTPHGVFLAIEDSRSNIKDELDFWERLLPSLFRPVFNGLRTSKNAIKNFTEGKKNEQSYSAGHPGHPGQRTLQEYLICFSKLGMVAEIESLYLPFLPVRLLKYNQYTFNKAVRCTKIIRKLTNRFEEDGSPLHIKAKFAG